MGRARLALVALLLCIAVVTGCSPTAVPVAPATSKARTPLVVIPASAKTYSDRGVVAWKVYPYLSGKLGGFTVVGVDTKAKARRVTRVFDVPGKVAGAPATLAYVPLYPKSSGRTLLGNTGLVQQATMGTNTNARHIRDLMNDATAYLPSASSQGTSCSSSVKRVMACMTAPSVGDLSTRWTQVRSCRLAMSHLVKPQTCIKHSLKLKVPSGAAVIKTKDGDDDDSAPAGDDDDSTASADTSSDDGTQDTSSDDGTQDTSSDDGMQDTSSADGAQDTSNDTSADASQDAGDFGAGTDDNTPANDTTPATDDPSPTTDANGLGTTEANTAAGNDPIPSAGDTAAATNSDSAPAASPTRGYCAATDSMKVLSLHVLTDDPCPPGSTNTPDQGAFGASNTQANCSTCAATQPYATTTPGQQQVPIPPVDGTTGVTVNAGVSIAGLNANVSVTTVNSDPGYAYISVGGGATTQLLGGGVSGGPIAVHGDPQQVLTGSSVVSSVGGTTPVGGVAVEVQKNSSGTTVSIQDGVGPAMVPVVVTAGMSYGWRVKLPEPSEPEPCGRICD